MRLRTLLKDRLVTVKVYSDGCLFVVKGSISNLNLRKQALLVKDERVYYSKSNKNYNNSDF